MRRRPLPLLAFGLAALVVLALAAGSAALLDTPKPGGVLTSVHLYDYGRMQDVWLDK